MWISCCAPKASVPVDEMVGRSSQPEPAAACPSVRDTAKVASWPGPRPNCSDPGGAAPAWTGGAWPSACRGFSVSYARSRRDGDNFVWPFAERVCVYQKVFGGRLFADVDGGQCDRWRRPRRSLHARLLPASWRSAHAIEFQVGRGTLMGEAFRQSDGHCPPGGQTCNFAASFATQVRAGVPGWQ